MSSKYYLGVDVGTYSSKGVIVAEDGSVIARASAAHGMDMPHPGFFEQDADQVWWQDFVTVTQSLLRDSGIDPRQIAGVGTSAIGPCVLPVDDAGRPLRPGILYGIDTRATAEITLLEKQWGREAIFQRSGMNLSSQAAGPKVLWVRRSEPELYARARWFLTSQAYLVYRLTGQATIDVYTAGGYIPLFDVFQRAWSAEMAAGIIPLERLPRVTWSGEVVGTVSAEAARETGLAEGTPVVAGTADAGAEAVSAGIAGPGDMMLMFGSSIFFILQTERFVATQHFWASNFLEPDTYAFTGGMSTAGSLTTWFRDQLASAEVLAEQSGGENAYAALAAAAEQSPLGARGLVCLPYFEGERTPLHDPQAKGVWFGLSLKHTRGDLYRAIMEGVAYGIRHNLEEMAREGVRPRRILVAGGGARSPLWMQIVADVCNVVLTLPDQADGASYGDAFLAAVGTGQFRGLRDIGQWVSARGVVHPDVGRHEQYEGYYRVFRELYISTRGLMSRLDELRK